MKKLISGICLLLVTAFAHAQNGLEGVIVEKYYVSNAADAAAADADAIANGQSTGRLPVGSVTYRIYADMLPGYKFQALYGVQSPAHNTILTTSTSFYNNPNGSTNQASITKANVKNAIVALDSWFSVGAVCNGNYGILKSEDDGLLNNVTVASNPNNVLLNNDAATGIALTTQDGMIAGSGIQVVTPVGMTTEMDLFGDGSVVGNSFNINNASVASLNGSSGPTAANKVLIGQFTTDGAFHYELNIQIGTPTGGTQSYVANSPVGAEISIPSLKGTFAPNVAPTVNITAPSNGANVITGSIVNITATAGDTDGSVDSVAFYVNGVRVGVDLTGTPSYSFAWTSTPGTNKSLTAIAYDNSGAQTTSAPVIINVVNNLPPTVSITSPAGGASFTFPAVVAINATAGDTDGSVDSVAFFVNGVRVGVDLTSLYSFNWTSVIGTPTLTAKAYDNSGAVTTSAPVSIAIVDPNALAYQVGTISNTCDFSNFCLPVIAVNAVKNVIGYDFVLHYDKNKVTPTGVITVSNALINPSYVSASSSINTTAGTMSITLYFNSSAPANTTFNGTGSLLCIGFTKTGTMAAADTALFTITNLQESYFTGVTAKLADPGKYISVRDTSANGLITFWSGNGPLKYDSSLPGLYLPTNIYGNNAGCSSKSAASVRPDTTGRFNYNIINGVKVTIERNILAATSVQPVINGADALMVRQMLLGTLTPNVYQAIAMDVNMDGVISAGDLSQINQRSVLLIPEFKQAWNYDSAGVSNGQPSRDWQFIDANTISTNPAYAISSTFPADNGVGYSKSRVPVVPSCLPLAVFAPNACPVINTYKALLIGDINGNFSTVGSGGVFRTADEKVIFDLSNAVNKDGYIDVPVSVSSANDVNALDFAMQFNESNLTFSQMVSHSATLKALSNFNAMDRTLRFTSNSVQNFDQAKSPVSVRFSAVNGQISEADITSVEAYLNGERVPVEFNRNAGQGMTAENMINIYPNPASSIINITIGEDATIQIMDAAGRQVLVQANVNANEKKEIATQNLANGIYMMRIANDNFVTIKKIVINK